MMKRRLGEVLFLLANGLTAFLWMKIASSAYEIGGYLRLFGQVQAAIIAWLLSTIFSKNRNYSPHTVLTVMQLFPIICYTIFQGADGGWVSIFSVICLALGIYVLCNRKANV